ncbi:hypothetical protein PYH37_004446 [Sinorhizobium numidicum]|uniref:Uncharacterized protein n=1 Tax=Sinorhizobium numidicum TaxID=680248 RepID=A0ABY8D104_9HYPH|nr:hypothetical protein [Sinorhizobium numidicum]WEX76167.1 hypothetical protein PYH37_004446 [Sinorhizobium numidicum]WEX82826.1 hypothetical protein PYH38_005158 [Sinorhizobium numidicum]
MRRLSLGIASLLISVCTVSAEPSEIIKWKDVNGWTVASDVTMEGSCFIISEYEGGVTLRLGFHPKGSEFPFYMMFGNDDWKSIEIGKDYDLSFQFDRSEPWTASARVAGDESGKFLFINLAEPDFLSGFVRKRGLKITFEDRVVANLSLRDSGRAAEEMLNCQKAVDKLIAEEDEKRDPFGGKAEETDPFTATGGRGSSKDPFSL